MDKGKTQKIEDQIRDIYYQKTENDFWDYHVAPVIREAKRLAEKHGANEESVWLAAILHDLGQLDALEPHEEIGSEKAYKILLTEGFGMETAANVKEIILTHRCNKHFPSTLEQKILATADALAHFKTPHYFWITQKSQKNFSDMLRKYAEKIERDFNEKIFFEDEKVAVREQYEVLKKWFNYKV